MTTENIPQDDLAAVEQCKKAYDRIRAQLSEVIVGQRDVIEQVLVGREALAEPPVPPPYEFRRVEMPLAGLNDEALGRLGDATRAVELLTSDSFTVALDRARVRVDRPGEHGIASRVREARLRGR
jgi:hypothetical protein